MDLIFVEFVVSTILSVISLPISVISIYLIYKYYDQEFLRIRGMGIKLCLSISVCLLSIVFAPSIFISTWINDMNDTQSIKNGNNYEAINEYKLLASVMIVFAIS